jgi:hypothetical protein
VCQDAGFGGGGMCHVTLPAPPQAAWPGSTNDRRRRHLPRKHAGFGVGGTPLPSLAQAARAMCRLARRAAIFRGSLLINIFRVGPFLHYVDADGPMRQKFKPLSFSRS